MTNFKHCPPSTYTFHMFFYPELFTLQNFGLDYIAYSELIDDCPLRFLYIAFRCCQVCPVKVGTDL